MKTTVFILISSAVLCNGCTPESSESSHNSLPCFNADAYLTGNQYSYALYQDGKHYANQTVNIISQTDDNIPLIKEQSVTYKLNEESSRSTLDRTFRLNLAKGAYSVIQTQSAFDDGYGAQHIYTPNMPQRFDFETAEEKHTNEYTLNSTFFSPSDKSHFSNDITLTSQYIGQESITTPAGQFTTCHVKTISQRQQGPHPEKSRVAVDRWYDNKRGILVKLYDHKTNFTQTLLRASINGQQLSAPESTLRKLKLTSSTHPRHTQK
ncbi:hypothetical protein [Vibrio palustris]|uniref:Uncharacterized protein n=1 Tax=Vibrio palustris TaxID=1918946 RepID=A0A1R4B5U3_9VIBR|nr:hypothetical protein [Vibrio palustris]SJL84285.1 hypothetical protein VPAL9027_02267 [Vibrio palustris]